MGVLRQYERKLWPIVEAEYEARLVGWRRAYHKMLKMARPMSHPLKRMMEAWRATSKYGQIVQDIGAVPRWQQLAHQLMLYGRYGLPPGSYYKYRLFDKKHRDEAGKYIHHKQMDVLLKGVNLVVGAEEDVALLANKLAFFRHCQRYGLPTAPILLAFEEGKISSCALSPRQALPRVDLFSKPTEGGQGFGARRWVYVEGSDAYRDKNGNHLDAVQLKDTLKRQSGSGGIILQTRLENHPTMRTLAGETLCTARMVTGRKPGGQAEHLISTLRMSANDGATDNFSKGGIGAPIDASTGRLGTGSYMDLAVAAEELERHPLTGKAIAGFTVPSWHDAVKLVERAHDTLPRLPFVGWDVGFTHDGPVIVEGNAGFGANVLQIPHRRAMGCTRFVEYYNDCLSGKL